MVAGNVVNNLNDECYVYTALHGLINIVTLTMKIYMTELCDWWVTVYSLYSLQKQYHHTCIVRAQGMGSDVLVLRVIDWKTGKYAGKRLHCESWDTVLYITPSSMQWGTSSSGHCWDIILLPFHPYHFTWILGTLRWFYGTWSAYEWICGIDMTKCWCTSVLVRTWLLKLCGVGFWASCAHSTYHLRSVFVTTLLYLNLCLMAISRPIE